MLYELVVVVFTSWGIKINIFNTELQFCILLFCLVSVSKSSWVLKLFTTHKYYKHDASRISAFEMPLCIALPGLTWVTDPWSPTEGLGLVVEVNWSGRTTKGRSWLSLLFLWGSQGSISLMKAGILPPRTLISNGARQWIVKSKPPYETSFLRELESSWEDIPVTINWKCHRRIPSHVGFLFFLFNSWCFFLILTLDFGLSHSNAHFCFLLQCYQQQENCLQQCHSEEFC